MQDSLEQLGDQYDPSPELQGPNSAVEAADMLRKAAAEAGSAVLDEISDLVEKSQQRDDEGLDALADACKMLEEVADSELPDAARPAVETVLTYVRSEMINRQVELSIRAKARDAVSPNAQPGENEGMRLARARAAVKEATRAGEVADTAPEIGGAEPLNYGGTHDSLSELRRLMKQGPGVDQSAFSAAFQAETQRDVNQVLMAMTTARFKTLGEGETVPDTVYDVLGNHPEVSQILTFVTGKAIDPELVLRGTFTEFADQVGLTLPEEITSRLSKPERSTPPPP